LLSSAVVGVIYPSGDEIGPFRAIEESTLTSLTQDSQRIFAFAWQNILGTYGGALGSLSAGWIGAVLERRGISRLAAYRIIFVLCGIWAVFKMILCFFLSDKCEKEATDDENDEHQPLLPGRRDTTRQHLGSSAPVSVTSPRVTESQNPQNTESALTPSGFTKQSKTQWKRRYQLPWREQSMLLVERQVRAMWLILLKVRS
jgi:MFS family permease